MGRLECGNRGRRGSARSWATRLRETTSSLKAEFHLPVFLGNLPGLEEFEGKSKNGDSWDDSTSLNCPHGGEQLCTKKLPETGYPSLTKEHTATAENLEKTDLNQGDERYPPPVTVFLT